MKIRELIDVLAGYEKTLDADADVSFLLNDDDGEFDVLSIEPSLATNEVGIFLTLRKETR